jgi:hypothetical protein
VAINIPIITEFDGKGIQRAIKEFKQLETSSQKAQFVINKAALPATAAITALGTATFKAANLAADLREEQSKVGVVFGNSSKQILAFSKTTAKALGQSQTQALQAAGTFGVLGKAAGLTGDDLAAFATEFTVLASDLASFNNTTPEEAVQAIGAALRGEAEPIRRFGVLLDDATLRAKALELGLISNIKNALTPQQKSLAAQAAILEQTTDAQGDFARTSQGAANQQRILAAQVKDAATNFGNAFLPALEKILPILTSVAEWVGKNSTAVAALTITFGGIATALVIAKGAMIAYRTIAIATTAVNAALAASGFAVQISTGIGIATAIAGAAALAGITATVIANTSALNDQAGAVGSVNKRAIEQAEINGLLTKTETTLTTETAKGTAEIEKRTAKLKDLRKAIKDDFAGALESARGVLAKARDDFANFSNSVSDAITGAFSFKDAQEAGKETGRGFLASLTDQVTKTRDFAVKINRLLAAGLSEGALQQVLAAGQDAGGAIADELLAGGAAAIGQANALTAEVQALGTNVGQNAATQFRQAGVDAGAALVAGITQAISNFQLKLKSKKLTPRQLARLQKDFGVQVDFMLATGESEIPALANGGIIRHSPGGTLALIGEGGRDEAVIPLDRMGGMGNNVTINVNGGDPNAVVDALRRYMQLNGSVPIRVSST